MMRFTFAAAAAVVLSTVSTMSGRAQSAGQYSYTLLASLGDPAPGGGTLVDYFELGGLNNQRDLAIAAGVTLPSAPGFGEAVLLLRADRPRLLIRSGEVAPGGSVFGGGSLFPLTLNDRGDVAVSFSLEPFQIPLERTAGVFVYDNSAQQTSAVILPGVPSSAGTFAGVGLGPSMNNARTIAFAGLVPAGIGPGAAEGVGSGIFARYRLGQAIAIVRPGDAAPEGGVFDWAAYPSMNADGDVAFAGHRSDQKVCPPPAPDLLCFDTGIYLYRAAPRTLEPMVRTGDPAPDGGLFTVAMFARLNSRRDVAFLGRTTNHPNQFSVFARTRDGLQSVAIVGDAAPGGGRFLSLCPGSTGTNPLQVDNGGIVSFLGLLDTDVDGDGRLDSGAFQWKDATLTAVARTGTEMSGIGTVRGLHRTDVVANDRGDVAFWAQLTDGREVLILAEPRQ